MSRNFKLRFIRSSPCSYRIQVPPPQAPEPPRYIFDGRVEQPIKPCKEKPWQGLIAQVDRVLQPARDCQNPHHSSSTCNCGSSNYQLPIIYGSRYDNENLGSQNALVFTFPDSMSLPGEYDSIPTRMKREASPDLRMKSKRRDVKEMKFPKLKPLKKFSSKSFKTIDPAKMFQSKPKSKSFTRPNQKQLRRKRKPDSPCGYTYESCDPKKHNRDGCPLCYKCKCEPVNKPIYKTDGFSHQDIKVPYKIVTHDEAPGSAPMNQEFDDEPSTYTGLKEQDLYKKYIQQVIAKYPEHMSRKMPDVADQQRDMLKFISELSKADKSPGAKIDDEDIRYKIMDDAMEMYKYYEKAVNFMPKTAAEKKDGKFFKKRGKVLEVIELNPEDYHGTIKTDSDDVNDNISESQ